MKFKNYLFLYIFISLTSNFCITAQVVYESTYHTVYAYLSRIAQRGVIEYDDVVLPLPRNYIVQKLEELVNLSSKLTPLERKELVFYLKEYKLERMLSDTNLVKNENKYILKQSENDRFRFAAFQNKDFTINAQPIAGYSVSSTGGDDINTHRWNGARIYGYMGKNFGYSFDFRDNAESGPSVDRNRTFSPETGIIGATFFSNPNAYEYSVLNANMSYSWKWGVLSAGKENLTWGYGEGGKIVLSNKAPSFPLIRLDVYPTKWLRFNYAHCWLNSNLVDSAVIYNRNNPTITTEFSYRRKYLVTHSLIITPLKGLSISVGESAIYNDDVKFVYFIPILFYRAMDHYLGGFENSAISNGQFFGQISSRNHIKKTHLYFSIFIDELSLSKAVLESSGARNQTAYTIGGSITDFPIKNLFLLTEYTKVQPFAYVNHIVAQSYQNSNYNLGHWIGPNADQWISRLSYRIRRGLELKYSYQTIRKGIEGTPEKQSSDSGTPFLGSGIVRTLSEHNIEMKYELVHDLFITGGMTLSNSELINNINTVIKSNNSIHATINYGF